MRIPVVIPAYEPDDNLIKLCRELIAADITDIIVVDDGSGEDYASIFELTDTISGCTVLHHSVNQGKGKALKTAFEFLLADASVIGCVTADSDGQHTVTDITRCIEQLKKTPDKLVMGCRQFDGDNIPRKSKFGNTLTCKVCGFMCGVHVSDTQTGLRAIPADFMRHLLTTPGNRFEFETNMLVETRGLVEIVEIPIETIYDSKDNHKTHFRAVRDSIRIYSIFGRIFLKYLASSLSSSLIDMTLFAILCHFLRGNTIAYITIATVIARIVSATYNYLINYTFVFKSSNKRTTTFVKYAGLAIVQMCASALLVNIGVLLLSGVPEVSVKIVVDIILFFISYKIQQIFVF